VVDRVAPDPFCAAFESARESAALKMVHDMHTERTCKGVGPQGVREIGLSLSLLVLQFGFVPSAG
jgi:hypothetical protein